MDFALGTLEPSKKVVTKPSFLNDDEWKQIEHARAQGVSFRQLFRAVGIKLKMSGRPFFSSRDTFCRSFYLWRNGETHV